MPYPAWFADAHRDGIDLPACISARNIGWVWDPVIHGWDRFPLVPAPPVTTPPVIHDDNMEYP